ncbi:MAG: discoidin domain-containing protein [Ignavibacteriales bacterium]|nr:discoidin domain-containing protein [Ignavibacteriales bacterium]
MRILAVTSTLFVLHTFIQAQTVNVTVEAGKSLHAINPWLYGINAARWDESLFAGKTDEMLLTADRDAIAKIKASGVTLLKYPGGNDADHYIWNSPSNYATEMDTDEYIALCREVRTEPFITINFNEPARLAADWVHYCNIVRKYDVKLWEVGDEQWGTWAKGHSTPEDYAKKYVEFVKAMKAVDPTIKVATNLAVGSYGENWNERVLRAADGYFDMFTFTFFPISRGKENDDTLFASVLSYRKMYSELRNTVERVLGNEKTGKMLFVNVGYNSVNHSPGPFTLSLANALWTADMIGTMAELRTDIGCFWALHNQYPPGGGDFGYLSSDGTNTPRVSYYVFPLFAKYFGDEALQAHSADPLLSVYASRKRNSISLALVNKDKKKTKTADVDLSGFKPGNTAEIWLLDESRKAERMPDANIASKISFSVPPYSFMVVRLASRDSLPPPQSIALLASPSASSASTMNALWGPGSFDAQKAVDGRMDTRWRSGIRMKPEDGDDQWFQLSWRTLRRIARVRIHWGENHGIEYRLQASSDGKTWKTIHTVSDGNGGTETFDCNPVVEGRYLRIRASKGTEGGSAYAIRELEVFEQH